MGNTRELSKVFFETVSVKTVDHETDCLFANWLSELIERKQSGRSVTAILNLINQKLAEIYKLTEAEVDLIALSESSDNEGDLSIVSISEGVRP